MAKNAHFVRRVREQIPEWGLSENQSGRRTAYGTLSRAFPLKRDTRMVLVNSVKHEIAIRAGLIDNPLGNFRDCLL